MNESIFINDLVLNKTKALKQFPDKAVAEFFIDEMFRFLFYRQRRGVESFGSIGKAPPAKKYVCISCIGNVTR